jgi:hypothetical protein
MDQQEDQAGQVHLSLHTAYCQNCYESIVIVLWTLIWL